MISVNPAPAIARMVLLTVWTLLCVMIARPPVVEAAMVWRPVGTDKWVPLVPDDGSDRVTLRAVADDGSTSELHGRWSRLAPGDTVGFAIRGEGALRVETRPQFATDAAARRYRLGVHTAPDVWRLLVRREEFATAATAAGVGTAFRLGSVDRWETALLTDSERVLVTLREERSAPVWVRVLARGDVERLEEQRAASATVARRPESDRAGDRSPWTWELGVTSGAGHDGNAYLTPRDVADTTAVRDAWFLELALDAELVLERGLPFELELDYAFYGRFYDDTILDETRHRLLVRQTFDHLDLGPGGDGRLRLDQKFRSRDRTFFGRGDFEEFITGSDAVPGADVPLGDRFDWREWSLSAVLRLKPTADWEIELTAFWLHRDYTEDYDREPDIYALDQNRTGAELAVRRDLAADWDLGLAGEVQWWDYAEKFARNAQGDELADVTTRLRRVPLEMELRYRPRHGLRGNLAAGTLITRDLQEGYWDRQTLILLAKAEYRARGPWSLDMRVRRSVTDYDVSTVGNVPGGPLREKDSWRASLGGEYRVHDHVEIFAEWDWKDRENNSRTFAYRRAVVVTGVRGTF